MTTEKSIENQCDELAAHLTEHWPFANRENGIAGRLTFAAAEIRRLRSLLDSVRAAVEVDNLAMAKEVMRGR